MLPNALKEAAEWGDNLQLIVDNDAAAIPWEMMVDRHSHSDEPPAVASGLLRQLRTERFRERPFDALDRAACIIGDPADSDGQPIPGFVPLDGAVEECEKVTELLQNGGYSVESAVRKSLLDIMNTLHRRDYRILHLAGHGVHAMPIDRESDRESDEVEISPAPARAGRLRVRKRKRPHVSGMVIGPDITLSPSEVEKMLVVPGLVFINCCELGRTKGETHWPEFAANIAGQFISMGARCVVASGWEVDDRAAVTFATEFYRRILRGETFGDSVKWARRLTWESHPRVNTWGAYQCYGDPGWRLEQPHHDFSASAATDHQWLNPTEPLVALENLSSQLAASRVSDVAKLRKKLDWIERSLPDHWKRESRFAAALGIAWSDLCEYEKGLEFLQNSLTLNGTDATGVLIRLCDCRNRLSSHMQSPVDQSTGTRGAGPEKEELWQWPLKKSIDDLDSRISIAVSFELLMARRVPHRRWALLTGNSKDRVEHLRWATYYTIRAKQHFIGLNGTHEYNEGDAGWWHTRVPDYEVYTIRALLSALAGAPDPAWVSRTRKGLKWKAGYRFLHDTLPDIFITQRFNLLEAAAWSDELELQARQQARDEPSFWHSCWSGACPLLRLLVSLVPGGKETTRPRSDELLKSVAEGYGKACQQGASPRERDAIVGHMRFIAANLSDARVPVGSESKYVSQRITEIADELYRVCRV